MYVPNCQYCLLTGPLLSYTLIYMLVEHTSQTKWVPVHQKYSFTIAKQGSFKCSCLPSFFHLAFKALKGACKESSNAVSHEDNIL